MEGGTAPGTDGLLMEFYKAFWAKLSANLLASLNETLAEGSLPLSCRRAVICQRRETCRLETVKVLYQDTESVLKINGVLSVAFKAERDIWHSYALSGMLYFLAIKPLLNRLCSKIKGFVLPQYDVQHRISAYADDVKIMVNGQADIDHLMSAVQDFGN
ncbi:hypothetical protein SRHO_G00124860 [Serrasalmus rhombeus]